MLLPPILLRWSAPAEEVWDALVAEAPPLVAAAAEAAAAAAFVLLELLFALGVDAAWSKGIWRFTVKSVHTGIVISATEKGPRSNQHTRGPFHCFSPALGAN